MKLQDNENVRRTKKSMERSHKDGLEVVYHIVAAADLQRCVDAGWYSPDSLKAEGFVHCSGNPGEVLEVADTFFAVVEGPVLVLQLCCARLSSRVVWEPGVPVHDTELSGGQQRLFPHIYGPVNVDAVSGVGILREGTEAFAWPKVWSLLSSVQK